MLRKISITFLVILLGGCANSLVSSVSQPDQDEATTEIVTSGIPTSLNGSDTGVKNIATEAPNIISVERQSNVSYPPVKVKNVDNIISKSAYRIGPQDVIEVSVFKVPELSVAMQVSEAGTLNLPLLGEVAAAGRTAREVERDLTDKYGKKYLQNPQVTVFVKEFNSQKITIEGAVKKPGVFPIQSRTSLLQAIAMAQGLADISDNSVLIFRQKQGRRQAARFDIDQIRSGDIDDPQLHSGDVIVAQSSAVKEGINNLLKALPITGLFAFI